MNLKSRLLLAVQGTIIPIKVLTRRASIMVVWLSGQEIFKELSLKAQLCKLQIWNLQVQEPIFTVQTLIKA